MKNKLYIIIPIIIIIILVTTIFVYRSNNVAIKDITKETYQEELKKNNFSIIYLGELTNNIKNKMKLMKGKYNISLYSANMSVNEINDLLVKNNLRVENLNNYILYTNETPVAVLNTELSDEKYVENVEKYFFNIIPESERAYKVIDKADDYIKMVKSKKNTIAVFGYEGCSYCNLFIPVFNNVAKQEKLDIYYFDRDNYNVEQYEKIMDLDLKIPAECTLNGKESSFTQGFPKPMTIITKSGDVVGCVRGYVTEDVLTKKLKEFGVLEE